MKKLPLKKIINLTVQPDRGAAALVTSMYAPDGFRFEKHGA